METTAAPYSPWSTNTDEQATKNDSSLGDLVASILSDKPAKTNPIKRICSESVLPAWKPISGSSLKPNRSSGLLSPNFCTPPSKKPLQLDTDRTPFLHQFRSANRPQQDSFNLHSYLPTPDVSQLTNSCYLDRTGDQFNDNSTIGRDKTDTDTAVQSYSGFQFEDGGTLNSSGISGTGSGDYINPSINLHDNSDLLLKAGDMDPLVVDRLRKHLLSQSDTELSLINSPWARSSSFYDNSRSNYMSPQDKSYYHSTPQQDANQQRIYPTDSSNIQVQERLIQQKFRELGLGNGTPPLSTNEDTNLNGSLLRNLDLNEVSLHRLDPITQQTTPQKPKRNGYSNLAMNMSFPSPIDPLYQTESPRNLPLSASRDKNLFCPILNQEEQHQIHCMFDPIIPTWIMMFLLQEKTYRTREGTHKLICKQEARRSRQPILPTPHPNLTQPLTPFMEVTRSTHHLTPNLTRWFHVTQGLIACAPLVTPTYPDPLYPLHFTRHLTPQD
uniref:uncharacterized protein LOC100186864 isoform X2 n=1 Tax=Ciona intestinalis TaxID=7719 RepID=UPI00089DC9B9|nr:uncharacterized protein LOC100186864 isoform X2 [Ciona intestinalis]|eukprot:XP_026690757.1 uncharacterized protein LOC100186864 isoform X2 [Ciona intestinalis]